MRQLIKLLLLIISIALTSIEINYHDDLRFSMMDIISHEFFQTRIFLKVTEALFIIILIEVFIGIFFLLTKRKKYEIVFLITLVLILILFFPFINLHGVNQSF